MFVPPASQWVTTNAIRNLGVLWWASTCSAQVCGAQGGPFLVVSKARVTRNFLLDLSFLRRNNVIALPTTPVLESILLQCLSLCSVVRQYPAAAAREGRPPHVDVIRWTSESHANTHNFHSRTPSQQPLLVRNLSRASTYEFEMQRNWKWIFFLWLEALAICVAKLSKGLVI